MTPDESAALRKPFPREVVGKLPKGGVMLDYVGHAAVTDRLLTIDPAWSWEPLAVDEQGLPLLDRAGNLWIKLTVCGVTRIGVGDGKSAKEVIGDALRNAAMRFGVALDLWTKDELESETVAKVAPRATKPPASDPPAGPTTDAPTNDSGEPLRTEQQSKRIWATARDKGMDSDSVKAWLSSLLSREVTTLSTDPAKGEPLTRREAARAIDALEQLPAVVA